MKSFIAKNKEIEKCMATHLIKLNKAFGVLNDDYSKFFDMRCKAISRELAKRLIDQAIDKTGQAAPAEETLVEEEGE
jgi:hypothetical protein